MTGSQKKQRTVLLAVIPQVHAGMMTMDLVCNGDGQSSEKGNGVNLAPNTLKML